MMAVSLHMCTNAEPLIMIPFTMTINHRAGIIMLIHCKTFGRLSMGKIKPESNIVGISNPTIEINIAISCESANVEINIPNDNAIIQKSNDSDNNRITLP